MCQNSEEIRTILNQKGNTMEGFHSDCEEKIDAEFNMETDIDSDNNELARLRLAIRYHQKQVTIQYSTTYANPGEGQWRSQDSSEWSKNCFGLNLPTQNSEIPATPIIIRGCISPCVGVICPSPSLPQL